MGNVLTVAAEAAVALWLTRFAIEQGEFITGWVFGWVWRSLEIATFGRVRTGGGRKAAAWAGRKVKGWASNAALVVADPLIKMVQSFVPPHAVAPVTPLPPLDPAPATPGSASQAPGSAPPFLSEADYKAAIARFGLSPSCSERAAARAYGKRRTMAEQAKEPIGATVAEVDADWHTVANHRNFRK